MFSTLDFLDSGLNKNWLEKDLLLNKESDIPTAKICIAEFFSKIVDTSRITFK